MQTFDTPRRSHISAKDSGDAGNFSITATGTGADDLRKGGVRVLQMPTI